MFNLWTTKNPLMSMFLSGANAWAGAARGIMTSQAKRHQVAAMREGTKQVTDAWAAALTNAAPKKRTRKKRS
ncbi:hypothetical protein JMJ56_21845 [Belnapia sp. T18]|uniref:Antifreeze protein n=1 Tax=Belnapia arida TaxID=2804533 RepID=A0ABS1U9Q7_9PROT|nr:hypothetical protein [Belnapia arida]MBL6080664.1 hypothetical protein [Belnapia arida]